MDTDAVQREHPKNNEPINLTDMLLYQMVVFFSKNVISNIYSATILGVFFE